MDKEEQKSLILFCNFCNSQRVINH